jgi:hypothetical protein
MEMMSFVQGLPLTVVLGFFGGELPGTPEQIVDGLLAQIE